MKQLSFFSFIFAVNIVILSILASDLLNSEQKSPLVIEYSFEINRDFASKYAELCYKYLLDPVSVANIISAGSKLFESYKIIDIKSHHLSLAMSNKIKVPNIWNKRPTKVYNKVHTATDINKDYPVFEMSKDLKSCSSFKLDDWIKLFMIYILKFVYPSVLLIVENIGYAIGHPIWTPSSKMILSPDEQENLNNHYRAFYDNHELSKTKINPDCTLNDFSVRI